ncbi:MAG TPA: hypothetical protein VIV65_08845 [Gemmatimonadaceae bacterium]
MEIRRFVGVVLGTAAAMACGKSDRPPAAGHAGGRVFSGTESTSAVRWYEHAMPLVLVASRSPDRALLVFADTSIDEADALPGDSSVSLLRLDSVVERSRIAVLQNAEGCSEAALDPAPSRPWGIGFIGKTPVAVPVDSLHGLSRSDSSRLTRVAYRLASTVPNGAGSRFGGLPFVLVDLWRFGIDANAAGLVATVRRQLNQEDSPLEERTFLVAESDKLEPDGYRLAYSERSSGIGDTVETRELIGVVRDAADIDVFVSHDFGDQTSYAIVERGAGGRWAVRWTSRRFSC